MATAWCRPPGTRLSRSAIFCERERPPRGGLSFCAAHVAVHESAFGTKRRSRHVRDLVAIGGMADMGRLALG